MNIKKKYKSANIFRSKTRKYQDVNKNLEAAIAQYCTKFLSDNAAQMIKDNMSAATMNTETFLKPNQYSNASNTSLFRSLSQSDTRDLFRYSIKQTLGSVAQLLERSILKKF